MPISDQNMWFFLPYIRTELLSSRVQHVSWEPYSYFRSKYVIFPTLYQNWTAVLVSPACVLETLFLFQIKICDFPTLYQNWTAVLGSPACVLGTLSLFQIKICDFFLLYIRTELLSLRAQHDCVLGTLSLLQIKICDFPYPLIIKSELLTLRVQHVSWEPCPISDQDMWFFLPYIRTELLSLRVQHVSWEPYSYFRSK